MRELLIINPFLEEENEITERQCCPGHTVRRRAQTGCCIQVIWSTGLTLKHHTVQSLISSPSLPLSSPSSPFSKKNSVWFWPLFAVCVGGWCGFARKGHGAVSAAYSLPPVPGSTVAPRPCGSFHPCPLWLPGQGWSPPHALKALSSSCCSQKVVPKLSSWFLAAGLSLLPSSPSGKWSPHRSSCPAKSTEAILDSFPSQATSKNPVSVTFKLLPESKFHPPAAVSPVSASAASLLDVS